MVRVLQILSIFMYFPNFELCGNSVSRDSSASSESKTEQPSKTEAPRAEKHTRQHMQEGICCCAAVEKIGQNVT